MPDNDIILEVKNLSRVYAKKEVLNIEHLSFRRGRIYGIIGPSGAGKSTFLRIINLLEPPTRGNIFFKGEAISMNGHADTPARREMTMVFQKPLLFSSTVEENIAYGLKARRFPKDEIKMRVNTLLEKVGLKEFAGRQAKTLSGGEAQRVALARAVAFKPALLLMDEPTANLDPSNVELIERLIMDLNLETDMTIIMVTHNIFQARRIAQDVIFLHEGRIVEMGETEKIFTSPANPRTRAFVEGRMIF